MTPKNTFKSRPAIGLGDLICQSIATGADTGITVQTYMNDDPTDPVDPLGNIKTDKWLASAAHEDNRFRDVMAREQFENEVAETEAMFAGSEEPAK